MSCSYSPENDDGWHSEEVIPFPNIFLQHIPFLLTGWIWIELHRFPPDELFYVLFGT